VDNWRFPEAERLDWWPRHVRRALANLGRTLGQTLGSPQLSPSVLDRVSREGLPGHQIVFSHVTRQKLGTLKEIYVLAIIGPLYAGRWRFSPGLLEKLARTAAKGAEID
jgi:hypothetical protein